ncbi:hypothetical protein CRG98_044374 [Punica granatum]|uniref:Exocyst subunit Exo70 family protein n=2 Tax=Punica granatum TaxID=22663 RepID=A0A2I0HU28_PUNGR|nr:hypothetical protein CRG98_044374 [Punica granatum]
MVIQKESSMKSLPSPSLSSPSKTLTMSSSLISLGSSCTSLATAEEAIRIADPIITKWDMDSSSYTKLISLFHHSRREAADFLKSVHELRGAMHFLVSNHQRSRDQLVLAQNLMQVAMKRLEKELYDILSSSRDKLDHESLSEGSFSSRSTSSKFGGLEKIDKEEELKEEDDGADDSEDGLGKARESIAETEQASVLAMSDLKSIADCMISAGYGKECVKIYKIIRKSIVDEGIYRLGIKGPKLLQIQKMSLDLQDCAIKTWLSATKVVVRTLFRGERILCDHVFSSSSTIRESCFTEITKDGAISLFKFPELVARPKGPSGRIYQLIELYEALSELWPVIDYTFDFKSTATVKLQVLSSLVRLGNTVQTILSDYEASIQKDSSRNPAPGGGIHPLTESVMSFICSLTPYSGTLSDILADHPHPDGNLQLPESYFGSPSSEDYPTSPVSIRIAWLILVLLCKLDVKAELYKDVALSYLFLANNLHFIVKKVSTTNLKYLLGDEWIARNERIVRQYASSYEAMAWTRVLSCLPEVITIDDSVTSPSLSVEEAKACFQKFNSAFEDAHRRQGSWVVPDGKLRDEIKVSIARKLVGNYRVIWEEYMGSMRELVRFRPDDLENYLSDLFHEAAISGNSSGSSSSTSYPQPRGCLSRSIKVY